MPFSCLLFTEIDAELLLPSQLCLTGSETEPLMLSLLGLSSIEAELMTGIEIEPLLIFRLFFSCNPAEPFIPHPTLPGISSAADRVSLVPVP